MRFELPNAAAVMNNAVAAVGEDGDSWEIVGEPLTRLVDEVVPAYGEKLDLALDPSAGAKRAEICTVRWGKIEKDVARLEGVAAAVRNVASVVRSGKDTIAHEWKGESFDAFRAQIEKVEKTLDDYATAVETTASGLRAAVDGTRRMFTSYRDDAVDDHLALPGRFSPPQDWRRMNHDDASYLADRCTSHGNIVTESFNCVYDDDPWRGMIDRKLVTRRLFDQLEKWDCTNNGEVVAGQYDYVVGEAYEERGLVRDKIHNWYVATDELKTRVAEALDAALENLRIIAEVKVFSAFAVPGATAPAGAPGGDPGPGTGGGAPRTGAGHPGPGGGGGEVAMPAPEPAPGPEPSSEPMPGTGAAAAAADPDPEPADTAAATVSVKDGDRTISVSSPDGHGRVKLTVDDGSGTTKTYALDFDAASGLAPRPGSAGPAAPEEGVEQVAARSDGKCVVRDGDVTITAERPLFSPDSLTVTVADGAGPPTSYTLDFPEEPATDTRPGQAAGAQQTGPAPAASAQAPEAARPEAERAATATAEDPAARHSTAYGQDRAGAPDRVPTGQSPAGQQSAAGQHAPAQAVVAGQGTHAQAWVNDQSGSLSGVLESARNDGNSGDDGNDGDGDGDGGEAVLAGVPDAPAPEADATGMAGAGLPVLGGPQTSGTEPGRIGSGWSVHGDLFDSGEPVHSMHGVLGDDLDGREER